MKVDYLFSKNNKIGSKLISWASSFEQLDMGLLPSHVAVLLNDTWVVESTFTSGVRVVPYDKWLDINEELYKVPCSTTDRSSTQILKTATEIWSKSYDWAGIAYFAVCFVNLIAFKKPLPAENKWENKNRYFCTEYVERLTKMDLRMHTPAKTYLKVSGKLGDLQ